MTKLVRISSHGTSETHRELPLIRKVTSWATAGIALLSLAIGGAQAQQSAAPITLKGGVTYTDPSSDSCEKQNASNPFVGMDPLTCHGVSAPTDSRGGCSLAGMQVWKKTGNTCYYCSPITSPPSIIIPMDQVGAAESQGWGCGLDQADACMAVCRGGSTYSPPPGTVVAGGGPGLPPTPPPVQGGPPPINLGPLPGPPSSTAPGANACLPFGPGGYDFCQNPAGTQLPPGCVCNRTQPTSASTVPNFSNQLLADAQTILLNAGRVSKAMTDSMDVTKHNNVGVGVGIGAWFGAAGKVMGLVAQQYKLLAAEQALAAAGKLGAQESSYLQLAGEATSESGTVASQAETAASELKAGSGAAMGTPSSTSYREGMVPLPAAAQPTIAQGPLPTCAVLSCDRLAQLLGKNIPTMRIFQTLKPAIKLTPNGTGGATVSGGLNPTQVAAGLNKVGINAEVGSGMTNMMNQVRAGNPVIAGVYTAASANSPLHAVVVEAVEARGGVNGLVIYDPLGSVDWQPITKFQKYFSTVFVKAI